MAELLAKFVEFIGNILGFVWETYFIQSGELLSRALEAPTSSLFEILFVLFFAAVVVTVVVGLMFSVLNRSLVPLVHKIESFVYFFASVGAWLIILLIAAMVYEVLLRYFWESPTQWAFEVAYMLMGTSFMFGIAYCLQMRRHVRVDFLYDNVPRRVQALIDLFGYMLLVPMLLWLCAGLFDYFIQAYRTNETSGESAWNPIIWPFKFSFVIGFVLIMMQAAVEILKSLYALFGAELVPPVVEESPPIVVIEGTPADPVAVHGEQSR